MESILTNPPQLFTNTGNGNHWIELNLVGVESTRDPLGAKVYVTAGGKTQLREFNSGNHRVGQDMRRLHFGLGSHATVDKIEVQWPSGNVDTYNTVDADQIITIEGKSGVTGIKDRRSFLPAQRGKQHALRYYDLRGRCIIAANRAGSAKNRLPLQFMIAHDVNTAISSNVVGTAVDH